jgi:hypothetical protein
VPSRPGAGRASAWYRDVFGTAEHNGITLPEGRLLHVELPCDHVGRRVPQERRGRARVRRFQLGGCVLLDCANVDTVAGLTDGHRPVRPRTVSDEKAEPVITATLEQALPGGDTHWSITSMARRASELTGRTGRSAGRGNSPP